MVYNLFSITVWYLTNSDNMFLLSSVFKKDTADLETEILLLKQSIKLSEINKENCEK